MLLIATVCSSSFLASVPLECMYVCTYDVRTYVRTYACMYVLGRFEGMKLIIKNAAKKQ